MLKIGSLVDGKYKILSEIGHGGMSVVYMAINEKANKTWAVKEVRKDGVLDFESVKQGLVAETDILKKLNHPSLPSIIDVIDTEDSFIIIMDYIQGNSLNKALDEYGARPQEDVIEWAKQLCDVLGYLHSRTPPIIYRDMKPANIMLKPDGNVTLIDFGTAREFKEKNLADTTCLGTVGYAAPEQFGGMGQTDGRTDIYCLGATLYHLVTGMNPCEPPYEIKPIREINPSLSSGLERIILKCTQRDPNDRYQSAAELMYALEHYEEIDDLYRKKQKKKLGTFIAFSALAVAFAGAAIWGYKTAESKRQDNYNYILNKAEDYEACERALLIDPRLPDAYRKVISLIDDAGTLTDEDDEHFKSIKNGIETKNSRGYSETVTVLSQLKAADPEAYDEFCYSVGEEYLYYYKRGADEGSGVKDSVKYRAAADWFDRVGDKEKYPKSIIYSEIAKCMQNIEKYRSSNQGTALRDAYFDLWDKINELNESILKFKDSSDSRDAEGKDLKLKTWNEVVRLVSNNVNELCDVSSKQAVQSLIENIKTNSEKIDANSFQKEDVDRLEESIADALDRIERVSKGE